MKKLWFSILMQLCLNNQRVNQKKLWKKHGWAAERGHDQVPRQLQGLSGKPGSIPQCVVSKVTELMLVVVK